MKNSSFWISWFLGCIVFVLSVNFVGSRLNSGAQIEERQKIYLEQMSRDVSTEIRLQHGWREYNIVSVNVFCFLLVSSATGLAWYVRRMTSENYGDFVDA